MSGQEDTLTSLVRAVAAGHLLLRDDRRNLVSRKELVQAVSSNKLLPTSLEVDELIRKGLIIQVDEASADGFHISITIDFLAFNNKLVILGFPLGARQEIARMYYPLYWALSRDIDSEVDLLKQEKGREPSRHELAYLRVISEWAVANTIGKLEGRILRFEPEGDEELQRLLTGLAKRNEKLKRKAAFGFQENEVARVIEQVWLPPFRYFREREIKAFLDITCFEPTREESRLLWAGHFDFALCDSNAVLQLVLEYNGTGHYGRSERERQEAKSRDAAKRRICGRAGVPILMLGSEFAFVDEDKKLLRTLLFLFRTLPGKVDSQLLHDHVDEALNRIGPEQIAASRPDLTQISEFVSRLHIYKIQKRADMLLCLLWEAYLALGKRAELARIMNGMRQINRQPRFVG